MKMSGILNNLNAIFYDAILFFSMKYAISEMQLFSRKMHNYNFLFFKMKSTQLMQTKKP
jgi:hypothetical protein